MPNGFDIEAIRREQDRRKVPPVVISLRLKQAAQAISVSEPYLRNAISEGKLKAYEKKKPGRGRGIVLIMVKDLEAFVTSEE